MSIAVAFCVAIYYGLILVGASFASANVFRIPILRNVPKSYQTFLGFSLFPVMVTWLSFTKIWFLPMVTIVCGGILGAFGLWMIVRRAKYVRELTLADIGGWIVPIVTLTILLIAKWGYMYGEHTHHDELRSALFTSTFASNGLKPAYPFDWSLPLAYPFYMFTITAFLHASTGGMLLPTVSLFTVALVSIALTYGCMRLICRDVFPERERLAFILASLIFTVSTLQCIDAASQKLTAPPQDILLFFHAGYHYLWGGVLGCLGLVALWNAIRNAKRELWLLTILCFALSFTFSGITAVWFAFAALPVLFLGCVRHRRQCWTLFYSQETIVGFLGALLILLPQFANFLPRYAATFYFSAPHVWFPRDVAAFLLKTHLPRVTGAILFDALTLLTTFGIPICAGLCSAIVCARSYLRSKRDQMTVFCLGALTSIVLLTFTDGPSGDWFGRGPLAITFIGTFLATSLFLPFFSKRSWNLCTMLLGMVFVVQIGAFALRLRDNPSSLPKYPDLVQAIHTHTSLREILYVDHYGDIAESIIWAGRSVITHPPQAFVAYLNHRHVHDALKLPQYSFKPCRESWYGKNTPQDQFIHLSNKAMQDVPCVVAKKQRE